MNKILFLFFLFFATHVHLQENLVPNGSFEEYSECPTENDLGNNQLPKCNGWYNPNAASSDYFNRCATQIVGIPNNFRGYQEPYDGDGYVGFVPMEWRLSGGQDVSNEYLQTKLKSKLLPCTEYYFELMINFANASKYGFASIGVLFNKQAINQQNVLGLEFFPQIINTVPLNDTLNWQKISGTYTANGSEEYLTIGYFFSAPQKDTFYFQSQQDFPEYGYGYYYIDGVKLIEQGKIENCDFEMPNVFTPNAEGTNDILNFNFLDKYFVVQLEIFNRWGESVYQYSKTNNFWNGNDIKGKQCTDGTYFYVLEYQWKDVPIKKTGFIQLIR